MDSYDVVVLGGGHHSTIIACYLPWTIAARLRELGIPLADDDVSPRRSWRRR